jgi:type II secretory pathway pseudopilin PulG
MGPSKSRHSGITLIELVVVMAILTFVTAIVTPSFSRQLDNFAVRSTGKRLVTMFRRAQVEAKVNRTPIWAVYENRRFVFRRGQDVFQSLELPQGVNVVPRAADQGNSLVFSFLPSGQTVGPAAFSISNARGRKGTVRFGGLLDSIQFVETAQ